MPDLSEAKLKQLRNLRPNRGKTDEEILSSLAPTPPARSRRAKPATDARFNQKLNQLQLEYSVDMNDSNDAELLRSLVQQQIQLENVQRDIALIQDQPSLANEDYLRLEKLGRFQSSAIISITTIQDKLGITRKLRKDKQVDDIPKYVSNLLARSKSTFDRLTIPVKCPKCEIELARFWLNFPSLKNDIDLSLECFKCGETIIFSR